MTGASIIYGASQFQTEFEYGISDRLELGLYVTIAPATDAQAALVPPLTEGTGIKERLRLRLAEEGQWPVDVGLYGELVENERELELEAKVILQRRIGDLRIVADLGASANTRTSTFTRATGCSIPRSASPIRSRPSFTRASRDGCGPSTRTPIRTRGPSTSVPRRTSGRR